MFVGTAGDSLGYHRGNSFSTRERIFRNMQCQFFFAWADILSEKNPYFGKHLFCKTRTYYAYELRAQDFATGKNFSFNQCSEKREFCFFSLERYFIKAIENFFPLFAYPDKNTRGVGKILDSYANPRLRGTQRGYSSKPMNIVLLNVF